MGQAFACPFCFTFIIVGEGFHALPYINTRNTTSCVKLTNYSLFSDILCYTYVKGVHIMDFYDISRDILSTPPFDGDITPTLTTVSSIANGDMCNISNISMSTHQATHIDAPKHFDNDGADIEGLKLARFFGKCTVVTIQGVLTGEDMEELLPHCKSRLILHGGGNAFLTSSAAQVIAESGIKLIGTDAPSIAVSFDEMRTHLELARAGIAVLENLVLDGVKDGVYTLSAFPIKLSDAEAAPCRAILIDEGKGL